MNGIYTFGALMLHLIVSFKKKNYIDTQSSIYHSFKKTILNRRDWLILMLDIVMSECVQLTSQNNVSYTLQIVSMLVFFSPVLFFTISMNACIKWHHYECSNHFSWDGSSNVFFLFLHIHIYVLTCTWITNMKKNREQE